MGFVPAGAGDPDYGDTAALLLALTTEMGFHVREVQTVRGGFLVPDAVFDQLEPVPSPALPEVTTPTAVTSDPPAAWDEPLPEPDVVFTEDGRVLLTEAAQAAIEAEVAEEDEDDSEPEFDRESIRAWARENGHEVAVRGRLKQSLIEAYAAAQTG